MPRLSPQPDSPLIIGAAGFLGLNLVDALLSQDIVPVCGRRRRENVIPLRSRRVPMVTTELDEPDTLVEAMRGHRVVYHMAGHYPRYSLFPQEALQTGTSQLQHCLDAAAQAGVERLVYLSSTATVAPNPQGGPSTEEHVFAESPGIGTYHDLKWAMEQMALAEDRLEVRVSCAAGCLGPWDLRVGTSAILVATLRGDDPPHPDGIINVVDSRDVGVGIMRHGLVDDAPQRLILSGGTRRIHELMCCLADRYGVPRPSAPMSDEAALAEAERQEREAHAGGTRAYLSREIADLIVHGVPVDASLAERSLGMSWFELDDTIDAWASWARRMKILPQVPENAA